MEIKKGLHMNTDILSIAESCDREEVRENSEGKSEKRRKIPMDSDAKKGNFVK